MRTLVSLCKELAVEYEHMHLLQYCEATRLIGLVRHVTR